MIFILIFKNKGNIDPFCQFFLPMFIFNIFFQWTRSTQYFKGDRLLQQLSIFCTVVTMLVMKSLAHSRKFTFNFIKLNTTKNFKCFLLHYIKTFCFYLKGCGKAVCLQNIDINFKNYSSAQRYLTESCRVQSWTPPSTPPRGKLKEHRSDGWQEFRDWFLNCLKVSRMKARQDSILK